MYVKLFSSLSLSVSFSLSLSLSDYLSVSLDGCRSFFCPPIRPVAELGGGGG